MGGLGWVFEHKDVFDAGVVVNEKRAASSWMGQVSFTMIPIETEGR